MAAKKTTSSTAAKAEAAGAKTPTDRQDAAPVEKKARNVRVLPGEVRLEWEGQEYVLEPDVMDDVDLILALEQNRNMTALVQLLGNAQWERFRAAHRADNGRVPVSEAEVFLTSLVDELQKVAKSGN